LNDNRSPQKSASGSKGAVFYLLRHGRITGEEGGKRFVGGTDVSLHEEGRGQARWWARYFAGLDFEALYSSDLSRCRETADLLNKQPVLPIQFVPHFREINLGEWEGQTITSVKKQNPEAYQARGRDLAHFRPPGGESFADLYERVVPAFERIVRQSQGPVLIIGHAGVNRMILCHVLGMPVDRLFRIGQDYGCLNTIETKAGFLQVTVLNQKPESPSILQARKNDLFSTEPEENKF
jgi:alpha-ribazole phosphatase